MNESNHDEAKNKRTYTVAVTTGESKAIHTMGVKTNASFSHLQFEFL